MEPKHACQIDVSTDVSSATLVRLLILLTAAGPAVSACQAYSSNAGLVRSATAVAQDIAADPNDPSVAGIPGIANTPPTAGTTPGTPAANPNSISVPGQPFTLRSALYEGGGTASSGVVITLWSMPLSCADYLANRVPAGASFVHINLPPVTNGAAANYTVVADADTPTAEQAYTYLNTATPQSTGAPQGTVSLSKVALGQSIEGSLSATMADGSTTALSFVGTAAATFCSL